MVRQGKTEGAFLYRYFEDLPAEGYEWGYGDRAAAGLIPTNDATCVFVATAPAALRRLRRDGSEEAFNTVLATAAPGFVERVAAATPASSLHGWAGARGFLRRCYGPGWALVGDAGYFKDPITTHGMSDAMRDAELLTEALLGALAGSPEAATLAAYERTRDSLSSQLFAVTEAVAGFDWDLDRVRLLLREVNSAMAEEVDHLQALPKRARAWSRAELATPGMKMCRDRTGPDAGRNGATPARVAPGWLLAQLARGRSSGRGGRPVSERRTTLPDNVQEWARSRVLRRQLRRNC